MLLAEHYCLITMAPSPVTHSPCLSPLISVSLLPPFIRDISLYSLRQLSSPTCPQAAVITLSSLMRSCQSPCYFSLLLPVTHLSSLLPSPLVRSGLHLADCTFFLLFSSIVKDLDTEKYVHLVSTFQKVLK